MLQLECQIYYYEYNKDITSLIFFSKETTKPFLFFIGTFIGTFLIYYSITTRSPLHLKFSSCVVHQFVCPLIICMYMTLRHTVPYVYIRRSCIQKRIRIINIGIAQALRVGDIRIFPV